MGRSKLDPNQIFQHVFEDDTEALRVQMLPTEMEMNISSESGDSVLIHADCLTLETHSGDVLQTGKFTKLAVYSIDPTVKVTLKAKVLGLLIPVTEIVVNSGPTEICSPEMVIDCGEASVIVVLQS